MTQFHFLDLGLYLGCLFGLFYSSQSALLSVSVGGPFAGLAIGLLGFVILISSLLIFGLVFLLFFLLPNSPWFFFMGRKKPVSCHLDGLASLKPQFARQSSFVGGNVAFSLVEHKKVILPSLTVSLTLGEEDTVSENSDFETQSVKSNNQSNVAVSKGGIENKAPLVNLFKDNRKMDENIMLKLFENQSEEVILNISDEEIIENKWGYGLVGYFTG